MNTNILNLLAVFIGGGTGASLRYIITKIATKCCGLGHVGTFSANILGCFFVIIYMAVVCVPVRDAKTGFFTAPAVVWIVCPPCFDNF